MARQPQPDKRPAPRLYLVTPPVGEAKAFARQLGEAVRAADIAAVLLRLTPAGERELVNRVKALASVVQDALNADIGYCMGLPSMTSLRLWPSFSHCASVNGLNVEPGANPFEAPYAASVL